MIEKIRGAAKKRILFTPHAVQQITNPDRMIEPSDIRNVIEKGEIIESYPYDPRGFTVLIHGSGTSKRPIHLVCTPTDYYLLIITAYVPTEDKWSGNFKKREGSWSV